MEKICLIKTQEVDRCPRSPPPAHRVDTQRQKLQDGQKDDDQNGKEKDNDDSADKGEKTEKENV